ncbi:MAG: hypothetical protein PVG40_16065, partial [Desulfobacterales bacterium]
MATSRRLADQFSAKGSTKATSPLISFTANLALLSENQNLANRTILKIFDKLKNNHHIITLFRVWFYFNNISI